LADRAVGLIAALAVLLGGAAHAAAPQTETGTVGNAELVEISGLARSRADPGILWAHNDSGNAAVLYRVGLHGEDLGRVELAGGPLFDWEDIASFTWRGAPALLLADTGDNYAMREHLTLYAVRDPGRGANAQLLWRMDFRYPDGAWDCEAVAVDPRGDILLLTKSRPPRLYRLRLPRRPPKDVQRAEFLGVLPPLPRPTLRDRVTAPMASPWFDVPTALALGDDGARAVIVTPGGGYLYRRAPSQDWPQAFAATPVRIALPRFPQIEAGALSADGRLLFVASEQRPIGFARIALPR